MKIIYAALLSVLLVGCAPATLDGVRNLQGNKDSFIADQNYQAVYRTVFRQLKKCNEYNVVLQRQETHGELYTDIKTGTVYTALSSMFGKDIFLVVDMKYLEDSKTEVITQYGYTNSNNRDGLIKSWVLDGNTECKV